MSAETGWRSGYGMWCYTHDQHLDDCDHAAVSPVSVCERCEGGGNYSELAPCTTFTTDCACNGPRVLVDPCPDCGGSGVAASPSSPTGPSEDEIERAAKAIIERENRAEGERWDDFLPDALEVQEAREDARAALTAAREAS